MQLTASQIQVITALAGAQGAIPELPDPFGGWFATEKEDSIKQASILLIREQLAVYQDEKLLLRNDLHGMWQAAVQYQHVCAVAVQSNIDVATRHVMYRGPDPQQSLWMTQSGFNTFEVSMVPFEHMLAALCRIVPVVDQAGGDPFRISTASVKRMLNTVSAQRNLVSAYDITNQYRGGTVEQHRIMYARNRWWYVHEQGEDSYFTPVTAERVQELFAQCLRMAVRA